MNTFLSLIFVLTAVNLMAQPDSIHLNLPLKPYYDGDQTQQFLEGITFEKDDVVYYEIIGETYHDVLPFTGWSRVESGITSDKPWDNRHPYDNHRYLVHSEGRYAPQRKQEPFKFYRIENGKKFSGIFFDSITNDRGIKELSFKGSIADGLLTGPGTFYFTSKDKYKGSKFKVGEIKSKGNFENGEMVGEWHYFATFGYTGSTFSDLLEVRHYEIGKAFPVSGKHYSYYSGVHYVGSEYAYEKDWVMKYVNQYNLYGNLTRSEELIGYKQIGDGDANIAATYKITAFVSDTAYKNVIHTKGQKVLKPRLSQKTGYWEYFYKNGNPCSKGHFVDDQESGIWTFYYENGKIRSKREYTKDDSKILEYWDKSGVQTVKHGVGKIREGKTFRIVQDGKVLPPE